MVEFVGHLTGKAEKAFVRKTRNTGLWILAIAILLSIPFIFFVGKNIMHDVKFSYCMLGALCIVPLFALLPKSKKEHMAMLPKRIYSNEDQIICVADRHTDAKSISDVVKVIDHGEFYELCFPFGKLSDKFICQKTLLEKGTIEEFESMFAGKILRKTGKNSDT